MNSENRVNFKAVTDVGCCRDHNEDSFLADPELRLWIVADGMGGHEGGEIASALAIQVIQQKVMDGMCLSEAVQVAHHEIIAAVESENGKEGMGSTVVALRMADNNYEIAWVGDSRAYLWNGQLRQLTRDHSFVQKLLDAGAITEEEALDHPDKSVIAQALGADCDCVEVDTVSGKLYRGEKLLLCSDGLSGEVEDIQIGELLADHEDESVTAKRLVNTALNNGGSDNVTVIVLGAASSFPEKQKIAATVPFDANELNARLDSTNHRNRNLFIIGAVALTLVVSWIVFGDSSKHEPSVVSGGSFQSVGGVHRSVSVTKQVIRTKNTLNVNAGQSALPDGTQGVVGNGVAK